MSVVGGDWRNGPAYDYVDEIGVEKIAHEFLRRNDQYAADYATLPDSRDGDDPPPALTRWGLRFCGGPARPSRPDNHRVAAAGRSAPCVADPTASRAVRSPDTPLSRPDADRVRR